MDARLYWIWMQQALVPGSPKTNGILRCFLHPEEVYKADSKALVSVGLTAGELTRLSNKSLDETRTILEKALLNGGWMLTPEDRLYPSLLRGITGLPLVIYGRGEMPNLDVLPSIAVVGTRETSGFGRRATALLAGGLALGGMVIVSGGARGVDTISHEAALSAGGPTVAVQACGLDINYPKQNEELRRRITVTGAVVSEFPPGTAALRHHFILRNRLISGMTLGTCVTEAPERSGALITAHLAFEQGHDVFAVAGDMLTGRSGGTDALIRQGARLVTGAEEILEEYKPRFPDILNPKAASNVRSDPRFRTAPFEAVAEPVQDAQEVVQTTCMPTVCPKEASDNAKVLFNVLTTTPQTLGQLIQATKLPASQVLMALTELEMGGCVRCCPGQLYAIS